MYVNNHTKGDHGYLKKIMYSFIFLLYNGLSSLAVYIEKQHKRWLWLNVSDFA